MALRLWQSTAIAISILTASFQTAWAVGQETTDCTGNDVKCFRQSAASSAAPALLQTKRSSNIFGLLEPKASEWTPAAVVPRPIAANSKCKNHVDLRKMGDWRYGQNGTDGDLAKCALLVHQKGGSWGCLSGIFHFAEKTPDGLSGCGCAITDNCASRDSPENDWDVYILSAYSVLEDGRGQGVDENRKTHFPMAPESGPKIWHKKTEIFKVAERSDCGDDYEPILSVDECRYAGNALNIEPWPLSQLPMFNGFCHWAWPVIPPGKWKHGDIVMSVPSFDAGCLVAPGRNRGKKISYFDMDGLLFNDFPYFPPAQKLDEDETFVKHRICKKKKTYVEEQEKNCLQANTPQGPLNQGGVDLHQCKALCDASNDCLGVMSMSDSYYEWSKKNNVTPRKMCLFCPKSLNKWSRDDGSQAVYWKKATTAS